MSSGGGPVSAASGGAASAITASRRQRGNTNCRNRFGGGNMSLDRRIASADFYGSAMIPEAA